MKKVNLFSWFRKKPKKEEREIPECVPLMLSFLRSEYGMSEQDFLLESLIMGLKTYAIFLENMKKEGKTGLLEYEGTREECVQLFRSWCELNLEIGVQEFFEYSLSTGLAILSNRYFEEFKEKSRSKQRLESPQEVHEESHEEQRKEKKKRRSKTIRMRIPRGCMRFVKRNGGGYLTFQKDTAMALYEAGYKYWSLTTQGHARKVYMLLSKENKQGFNMIDISNNDKIFSYRIYSWFDIERIETCLGKKLQNAQLICFVSHEIDSNNDLRLEIEAGGICK